MQLKKNSLLKATWIAGLAMGLGGCLTVPGSGPSDFPILDTHIHLYDVNRSEGVPWPPVTDKVLYRPVLAEHFDAICEANDVTATVIVEDPADTVKLDWFQNMLVEAQSVDAIVVLSHMDLKVR